MFNELNYNYYNPFICRKAGEDPYLREQKWREQEEAQKSRIFLTNMKSKTNVAFRNSEEQKSFPSQMRITEEKKIPLFCRDEGT